MPDTTVQKMIGCDHHLDQLDKAVAERLDPLVGGKAGPQPADQCAEHDRDQDLDIKNFIPRLAAGACRRSRDNGCRCHVSLPLRNGGNSQDQLCGSSQMELCGPCRLSATIRLPQRR
ncbi:hypothetical protein ABIF24_008910 [Bradyrhizobium elkanii]